jgi:hypothetical protein
MLSSNSERWPAIIITTVTSFGAVCGLTHGQAPGGYGAYFQQKAITAPSGGSAPSSGRYLYDKYFYHRPTVSPYLNVFRPDTPTSTSYHAYVRPEIQRRASASNNATSSVWNKPLHAARPTPSAYHNHWYGGWNKR